MMAVPVQDIVLVHHDGTRVEKRINCPAPPAGLKEASGRVFDHRGTETPSGVAVYYERRYRLPVAGTGAA